MNGGDFAFARHLDGVGFDEYYPASLLGTPAYCSPDFVGRPTYGKPVNIFRCGVLMYIALYWSWTFSGDNPEKVLFKNSKEKGAFLSP